MKLHPRHNIVNKAESQFLRFYISWAEENDLTVAEMVDVLLSAVTALNRATIKHERQNDLSSVETGSEGNKNG